MRKTPWYRTILCFAVPGLLIFLLLSAHADISTKNGGFPEATLSEKTKEVEKKILLRTNRIRKDAGKKPLKRDPVLDKIAMGHSLDMIRRNFFSHINPDGLTPTDRAKAAGYKAKRSLKDRTYITEVSENIGKMPIGMVLYRGHVEDTPESVSAALMKSWMARPGHRANIMRYYSIRTGIGVAWDGKYYVATQLFH